MNTKYAIVTGASSGIGRELAIIAARDGYDLLFAADTAGLAEVADLCRTAGADDRHAAKSISPREDGVDQLYAATQGRAVDALFANAGHGLGRAFLDQDFDEVRHVIDTNITGTIYLIQQVARDMVELGSGRILITGSIAGYMPGTFQAVYNGTKAFIDSFSFALRNELKDTGVTVTCLMPGATETELLRARRHAGHEGRAPTRRTIPGDVAQVGFDAMLRGDGDVVAGWKNKLQTTVASVTPSGDAGRAAPQDGRARHGEDPDRQPRVGSVRTSGPSKNREGPDVGGALDWASWATLIEAPPLVLTRLETPLGDMVAVTDDAALHLFEFHDRTALPTEMRRIEQRFGAVVEGSTPASDALARELGEYFAGLRTTFGVRIVQRGSPFTVAGVGRAGRDPLRRDTQLRPDRRSHRPPVGGPRRRPGQRRQPGGDPGALSPRHRRGRDAGRLRRQALAQEVAARP